MYLPGGGVEFKTKQKTILSTKQFRNKTPSCSSCVFCASSTPRRNKHTFGLMCVSMQPPQSRSCCQQHIENICTLKKKKKQTTSFLSSSGSCRPKQIFQKCSFASICLHKPQTSLLSPPQLHKGVPVVMRLLALGVPPTLHAWLCTHLQDTVSSTLVAGIAAVKGSASPMHAMFTEKPARSVTGRPFSGAVAAAWEEAGVEGGVQREDFYFWFCLITLITKTKNKCCN